MDLKERVKLDMLKENLSFFVALFVPFCGSLSEGLDLPQEL